MHTRTLHIERPRADIDTVLAIRNQRARTRHILAQLAKARAAYAAAVTPQEKAIANREVLRLRLEWRFLQTAIQDGRPINPPETTHRAAAA
jgi:hypothetical protein